jgi:16S rRNA (adenine1518-N6/adenine1519-N6)-dimethyltransferase
MHGHQPRKRFGQNFLADPHYVARIVDAIAPRPGDKLVEIGPGLAALTRPLIERAGHLDAVEIDRDLASRLGSEFAPAQLTLHVADALDFDFTQLGTGLRIVGNLPYNISSPLLFHLARFEETVLDIHAMLQKEVVDRMTAMPSTPEYGRLTVMLRALFRIVRLFTVPAGAFRPAPKVESAVVRLVPLGAAKPEVADPMLFGRVVAGAFGQRRKTMRNALSTICDETALRDAGIDPATRGETLPVEAFVRLSNSLARLTPSARP